MVRVLPTRLHQGIAQPLSTETSLGDTRDPSEEDSLGGGGGGGAQQGTTRGSGRRNARVATTTSSHASGTQSAANTIQTTLEGLAPRPPPIKFWCGLCSGAIVAGSFNPIDRALYLSVKNERPFLNLANFRTPYQGFINSLVYRAVSGGIYFPLEDVFYTTLQRETKKRRARLEARRRAMPAKRGSTETNAAVPAAGSGAFTQTDLNAMVAGIAAGTVSATLLNPIQAVRYHCWGRDDRTVLVAAREMFASGRIRPFTKGVVATVLRDSLFGGYFTFARKRLSAEAAQRRSSASSSASSSDLASAAPPERSEFAATVLAGMMAAALSAPMNFVRNMQFSSSPSEPGPSIPRVFRNLYARTAAVRRSKGTRASVQYAFARMNIGWGTMRVGLGMAVGALLYEALNASAHSYLEAKTSVPQLKGLPVKTTTTTATTAARRTNSAQKEDA